MTAVGYVNDGAVTSVNDETGEVDLSAADVGADPAGTGTAAAAAAVTTHAGATDPHADRAYTDTLVALRVRLPAGAAEQVAVWAAVDEWLRINTPWSAGDNNPDLLRVFNGADGTVKVFWLNGNGELRGTPSAANRVGTRFFEYPDGSSDVFWALSTNPPLAGDRVALVACYGTDHATMPGWLVLTETLKADGVVVGEDRFKISAVGGLDWAPAAGAYDTNLYRDGVGQLLTEGRFTADDLRAATALSVAGQSIPAAPAWSDAVLGTAIVKKTGQAANPGSAIERGRVYWRGSLQWPNGTNVTAGYQLAQVTAAHRPASPKSFSIRTVGSGSNISTALNLAADGWLTPEASLGAASGTVFLPIDGLTWDLS